jgi:hypothetical protein
MVLRWAAVVGISAWDAALGMNRAQRVRADPESTGAVEYHNRVGQVTQAPR